MGFELETKTKVKVQDVRTLSRKDRKPDELPGAQLLLSAMLPASALTMFDGTLAAMLYRKASAAKQGALDGMEGRELTECGKHIPSLGWAHEQTGCELVIDRGLGGKRSNIELDDCKAHRFNFKLKPTGVLVQFCIDAPALSDDTRGKLTGLKSTEIEITLALPKVQQEDFDDEEQVQRGRASKAALDASGKSPFPKSGKTGNEAGDAFAAAHKH